MKFETEMLKTAPNNNSMLQLSDRKSNKILFEIVYFVDFTTLLFLIRHDFLVCQNCCFQVIQTNA